MERLRSLLKSIDGRGYKSYKQLEGSYDFQSFWLTIDHVQGDPFALPSRISIQVLPDRHGLSSRLSDSRARKTALEDFLAREIHRAIGGLVKGSRGTGLSGDMAISCNGQKVLRRNAVIISAETIEARLLFALPAAGRTILAHEAMAMFFTELPDVVRQGLFWRDRNQDDITHHVDLAADQEFLRQQLAVRGAVAFLADGAVLPRASGVDDLPLPQAVPFKSPPELAATIHLPHAGPTPGMLLPAGITVIVGGGFHGKSTLLQALEQGIYNHRPEDGRELVITDAAAVKIRAEDHRSIHQTDISPFIGTLPGNIPTTAFSTENASGSTSQAANIIEALECGCNCLLIDEDTAATNFMLRDELMQKLVPAGQEPITPLLFRIRELYEKHGVSSVIVTGGCGDYLGIADRVLMMDSYRLRDVSRRARSLAPKTPLASPSAPPFGSPAVRRINLATTPRERQNRVKIQVREPRILEYGRRRIDLTLVEQLVDRGQTEAIGYLLAWCRQHYPEQSAGLVAALKQALRQVDQQGLDQILPWKAGHLAMPRLYELAAAANRLRQ